MEFWKHFVVAVMAILKFSEAASWTYTDGPYGPANWTKVSALCKGTRQSPIDYKQSDITYGQTLGKITMKGYDTPANGSTVRVRNNGHALVVDFDHPNAANISGTGLPGTFTLLNAHFHWGKTETEGSEHFVDGQAFPAEIHFVHYNMKYKGNLSAALAAKDGLAVLGVFFKLNASDNADIKPILDYAANVTTKGINVTVPWTFPLKPILPDNIAEFYRNNGSLTTPNCQESVTWTVFKNVETISKAQLDILRTLKKEDGQPLLKAYRPIQKTNGRKILATFASPASTTASSPTTFDKAAILTSILCGLLSLILKY